MKVAKASRQSASDLPRKAVNLEQSSTLYAGRVAGRGYSSLLHGVIRQVGLTWRAMTVASSNQVHSPPSVP